MLAFCAIAHAELNEEEEYVDIVEANPLLVLIVYLDFLCWSLSCRYSYLDNLSLWVQIKILIVYHYSGWSLSKYNSFFHMSINYYVW